MLLDDQKPHHFYILLSLRLGYLGATSIVKIGKVRLSGEIGGGLKFLKKTNFTIIIRYEILTFL